MREFNASRGTNRDTLLFKRALPTCVETDALLRHLVGLGEEEEGRGRRELVGSKLGADERCLSERPLRQRVSCRRAPVPVACDRYGSADRSVPVRDRPPLSPARPSAPRHLVGSVFLIIIIMKKEHYEKKKVLGQRVCRSLVQQLHRWAARLLRPGRAASSLV